MFNLYNNKVASLDINTEVERFQFFPKRFKGELRFHIIRECIPDLSPRKRETLPVIVRFALGMAISSSDVLRLYTEAPGLAEKISFK